MRCCTSSRGPLVVGEACDRRLVARGAPGDDLFLRKYKANAVNLELAEAERFWIVLLLNEALRLRKIASGKEDGVIRREQTNDAPRDAFGGHSANQEVRGLEGNSRVEARARLERLVMS